MGAAHLAWNVPLAPFLRHRTNRWGATAAEVASTLPGDELIREARMTSTRAITIAASPSIVWEWLAQIGHGRGGLYSYDGLENLVGCDLHSADRILDELAPFVVDDVVALGPERYPAFRVASIDAPDSLVLIGADPRTREVAAVPVAPRVNGSTWQWQLRPLDDGRSTRLIARQRYSYPTSMSVMWHVIEPIDFVMERQMLLGLKERCERSAKSG